MNDRFTVQVFLAFLGVGLLSTGEAIQQSSPLHKYISWH